MKKITSLVLAFVLLFTLTAQAFAQSITLTPDKNAVEAGEDVTVTVSFDEALEHVSGLAINLYFNGDLFTYKSGETFDTRATIVKSDKGTSPDLYKVINWIDMNGTGTISAGKYITCTFTAKEDIADVTSADFTAKVDMKNTTMEPGYDDPTYADSKISVTVTPAVPEGYVVTAAAAESAEMNSTVTVPLSITNKAAETYNAYYLEVTYDPAYLTYQDISVAGTSESSTVDTATSGTLKIAGVSKDGMTCGENVILLTFATGAKSGSTDVAVTTAKIDAKANASVQDAPAATLSNDTTAVTVAARTYTVMLPEGFTGPDTATEGEEYIFIQDDEDIEYDFTGSTMGGEPLVEYVNLYGGVDGEWSIPSVTGDIVIVAKDVNAPETVTILETGDAWGDVTRTGWTQSGDTVTAGTALDMSIQPAEGKTYKVTVNGTEITGEDMGRGRLLYTIPAEMVTGESITIDVSYVEEPAEYTVEAAEYLKLDGKSMFLITAASEEALAEGKVLSYGDTAMFWSEKYNAWAYLVISDKTVEEVKTEAAAAVTLTDGTKTAVAYAGDVNMTDAVDINDAQLVCNMYNAEYTDVFATVSMEKFLRADVTGDKSVNVQDAAAIIALLVQ